MSPLQHPVPRRHTSLHFEQTARVLSKYLQESRPGTLRAVLQDMTSSNDFCSWCGTSTGGCFLCAEPDLCTKPESEETKMTEPVKPPPYTATNDSITVVYQGQPITVVAGTPQFAGLERCIFEKRWDELAAYLTREGALAKYLSTTEFKIEDGKIFDFTGAQVPEQIATRIIAMASAGEDPTPVVNFYQRLALNPSRRSVQQLFSFLGHCGIPIQADGTFLAYKGVREDFLDAHSGTLMNTPGTTQRMFRNQISDDPAQSCHEGLHVGALEYARGFSSRVVVCEIDPQHVVCVPNDYSCQKMRVCEYTVIANYVPESDKDVLPSTTHAADVAPDVDDPEWGGDVEYTDEEEEIALADEPIPYVPTDLGSAPEFPTVLATSDVPEPKPVRTKGPITITSRPTAPRAASFNRKSPRALMEASIEDLRKYASSHLKIMGASKIPGGKSKLVSAILRARRKKARK